MLYSVVTTHPHTRKNSRKGWKMVPWPNLFHGLPKQVSSIWTATNVFVTMPSGAQHWFVGSIPENQQQWGRGSGSMEDLKFPLGLGGGFKYFICSPHFGGRFPLWLINFQRGLVQPSTSGSSFCVQKFTRKIEHAWLHLVESGVFLDHVSSASWNSVILIDLNV